MWPLAGIPVVGPFLALVPAFVWKWVGVFALAATIYLYADVKATHREHAKCEAAARAAQVAADSQDLKAEREGRAQDLEITNALAKQKGIDDDKIRQMETTLKHPDVQKCIYPLLNSPSFGRVREHGLPK